MRLLSRLSLDPYSAAILGTAALALVFPATGEAGLVLKHATVIAIALLFFLYGARLSPEAALAGMRHWRLHAAVFASTYALFPLIGIGARVLVPTVLPQPLYLGLMFLCCLPSTVQSSIAFTAIAGGNIAAAVCSASASNLIGIVLTPILVGLLLGTHGALTFGAIGDIVLQILVPFALGQLSRPVTAAFVTRHRQATGLVDRGSILLVIYAAFSEGMEAGIWHNLDARNLLLLIGVCALLLALVLWINTEASRRLGFSREDEIAIVFCGSKKSLASGLPMASVLFPAPQVALIALPLLLFHQIQLMACAALARHYAAQHRPVAAEPAA